MGDGDLKRKTWEGEGEGNDRKMILILVLLFFQILDRFVLLFQGFVRRENVSSMEL